MLYMAFHHLCILTDDVCCLHCKLQSNTVVKAPVMPDHCIRLQLQWPIKMIAQIDSLAGHSLSHTGVLHSAEKTHSNISCWWYCLLESWHYLSRRENDDFILLKCCGNEVCDRSTFWHPIPLNTLTPATSPQLCYLLMLSYMYFSRKQTSS